MQSIPRVALLSVILGACVVDSFHLAPPTTRAGHCLATSRSRAFLMASRKPVEGQESVSRTQQAVPRLLSSCFFLLASTIGVLGTPMQPANAISGGGKDYAEAKISGKDFSGGDYSSKDFSGAFAQQTSFINTKLRGARFYKASLKEADFTGADLTGASLENASLDGAIFKDAVLQGAYFSQSLEKVGSISGADFSDALMREDVQRKLCDRADATGTNPKTKVTTRDSLLCE